MTDQPVNLEELERLYLEMADGGPHEWGYRELVDGTFISDDWPFRVADMLPSLLPTGTVKPCP